MRNRVVRNKEKLHINYVIILALIFAFLANPIRSVFVEDYKIMHELFDDFEKNKSTESELSDDTDHEEQLIICNFLIEAEFNSNTIKGFSISKNSTLDFKPSIYLPPPRL